MNKFFAVKSYNNPPKERKIVCGLLVYSSKEDAVIDSQRDSYENKKYNNPIEIFEVEYKSLGFFREKREVEKVIEEVVEEVKEGQFGGGGVSGIPKKD